jgi:hypothetical protein
MKQISLLLWSSLPFLCYSFVPLLVTKKPWQKCELQFALRQSKQTAGHDIIERLDLSSEFSRWKLLQEIMEEEIESSQDVNEILYLVLKSFVDNPREKQTLTEEQVDVLVGELFQIEDNIGFIPVMPLIVGEYNASHMNTLELLEKLQPDPIENEDDFRSCWDILMAIYGIEATKIAQKTDDVEFKFRSGIVRLLLHYDFLTEGVGE